MGMSGDVDVGLTETSETKEPLEGSDDFNVRQT